MITKKTSNVPIIMFFVVQYSLITFLRYAKNTIFCCNYIQHFVVIIYLHLCRFRLLAFPEGAAYFSTIRSYTLMRRSFSASRASSDLMRS